jgi:hypothetical protein
MSKIEFHLNESVHLWILKAGRVLDRIGVSETEQGRFMRSLLEKQDNPAIVSRIVLEALAQADPSQNFYHPPPHAEDD